MSNDNKNDAVDTLASLLGLGVLGAMVEDSSKNREQGFLHATQNVKQQLNPKPLPIDGAKAAKEVYDAYVQVGFTEAQAFELLTTVLANRERLKR